MLYLFLLLSTICVFSQDHDLELYVRMMNLKGLPAPQRRREELFKLGGRLFVEKKLSGKGNISCFDCHSSQGHTADAHPLGMGEGAQGFGPARVQGQGLVLARHTPALFNAGLPGVTSFFWDGRVSFHPQGGWLTPEPGLNGPRPTLEEIARNLDSLLSVQALFPMASPEEMLGKESPLSRLDAWNAIMARLFASGSPYPALLTRAYPGVKRFTIAHVANALAEFQRHEFLAVNTPWDLYLRGKKNILTERIKKGAVLFLGRASCTNCHSGEHLSSFDFKNIGTPQIAVDDLGLSDYRFRVPALRNVALTAPYMHDGTFTTLEEVIEHYDNPMMSLERFRWNPWVPGYTVPLVLTTKVEEKLRTLAPNLPRMLDLTPDEKGDLLCFLKIALTDLKYQHLIDQADCPH